MLHWFMRNWADTAEPTHSDLGPLDLALPPDQVWPVLEQAVRSLPRWTIETVDPTTKRLTATRRTRLWRFIDDVTVRLEATPHGSRVQVRSQSRIGTGDLGQNRRNILELLQQLRSLTEKQA